MAVWRTKACELFGLNPGSYGFARGKVDLLFDLVESARIACKNDERERLVRIIEYVSWAAAQDSDQLASAVDLAFFLPVFRDPLLCEQLKPHIPRALFSEKWRLLMVPPSDD